jgi:hypothetical protein
VDSKGKEGSTELFIKFSWFHEGKLIEFYAKQSSLVFFLLFFITLSEGIKKLFDSLNMERAAADADILDTSSGFNHKFFPILHTAQYIMHRFFIFIYIFLNR